MANIYESMNPILEGINKVAANLSKNCFYATNDAELKVCLNRVKNFLKLSENEAALFCLIFRCYYAYNETPVHIGILSSEADTTPLRFLQFKDEFKSLEEKGFIYADKGIDPSSMSKHYRIPQKLEEAIVKNDRALLEEGLHSQNRELTYPQKIMKKELFYRDEIKADIKALTNYLGKEEFSSIQERLTERAMNPGVCIMFYGDSGTGKTESVYQIAKQTDRAIYHVDIGETISQWGGGTTTNLSLIFEKYGRFCRQAKERGENLPILLFNEADALFGRRIEEPERSYDVENNHIQSVLLDYIERQEGILIITTNLARALDKAFERRFLYKIKFEKPTTEIKEKIWKSKLNWLDKSSAEKLASSYPLSGGEIDNIARKATMQEILTGKHSSVKDIENWCQKEKLENSRTAKIGFSR